MPAPKYAEGCALPVPIQDGYECNGDEVVCGKTLASWQRSEINRLVSVISAGSKIVNIPQKCFRIL